MYIELLDNLRCVADHPQIPLVTAITERDGRFVVTGVMGCPECRREYVIEKGVACFGDSGDAVTPAVEMPDANDDEAAVRVAAFLDVSDGAAIALTGGWATQATEVAELTGARVFALNPPTVIAESDRVAIVRTGKRLPFAESSLRGIAIGEAGWSERDVAVAAQAIVSGGRIVLPVSVTIPAGLQEVAHDHAIRVAEKRGPLVTLHRR